MVRSMRLRPRISSGPTSRKPLASRALGRLILLVADMPARSFIKMRAACNGLPSHCHPRRAKSATGDPVRRKRFQVLMGCRRTGFPGLAGARPRMTVYFVLPIPHHGLLLLAETLDAEAHDVAGLEEALRLHARADAGRRAVGDAV